MTAVSVLALFLAALWGLSYSFFLWRTGPGRYVRIKLTWLSVAVGVGGDLVIMAAVLELSRWLLVAGIIVASSLAVIGSSVFVSSYGEHAAAMDEARGRWQDQDYRRT